jgi:hypothetical protein
MSIFKPTFLYIKRHTKTGLLYFGKTVNQDLVKYKGSGKYWTSHIKKHGKEHIETLWFCLYTDENLIKEAANMFSELYLIVKSKRWANLIKETGVDSWGTPLGRKQSLKTRKAQSDRQSGIKRPKSFTEKMSSKIWINNGQNHKRILKDEIVPEGWIVGRIKTWKSFSPLYSITNTISGEKLIMTRDEFCKSNNYPTSNPPSGKINSPIKYKHLVITSID